MSLLLICMLLYCVPGTPGGQKRALNPLVLELQMVQSRCSAGNGPLEKAAGSLYCLSISPAPFFIFIFFKKNYLSWVLWYTPLIQYSRQIKVDL